MIWFTSDTHFHHAEIIGLCHRPFADVDEMNRVLIENWNACVGPEDEVWFLGDFVFGGRRQAAPIFAQLNGKIHLLPGNHDRYLTHQQTYISKSGQQTTLHPMLAELDLDGLPRLILCHYPLREWNGYWRGAWHLYGHVHGNLKPLPRSLEVSVDYKRRYRPWSLEEIAREIE